MGFYERGRRGCKYGECDVCDREYAQLDEKENKAKKERADKYGYLTDCYCPGCTESRNKADEAETRKAEEPVEMEIVELEYRTESEELVNRDTDDYVDGRDDVETPDDFDKCAGCDGNYGDHYTTNDDIDHGCVRRECDGFYTETTKAVRERIYFVR